MMIAVLVAGGAALVATAAVGSMMFGRRHIRRRAPRTAQDDYRRAVGDIHRSRHRITGGGAGSGVAATGLWAVGEGTHGGNGDHAGCGGGSGGCGGGSGG